MTKSFGDLALDILENMEEEGGPIEGGPPPALSETTQPVAGYVPDISAIDLDRIGFNPLNEGNLGLKKLKRMSNSTMKSFRKMEKSKPGTHDRAETSIDYNKKDNASHEKFKKVMAKKDFRHANKVTYNESLLREFQEVIQRGKELIEEMTTCGMIGVNMAGPRPGKRIVKKKKKKIIEGSISLAAFLRRPQGTANDKAKKLAKKDKFRASKDPEFRLKRLRGVARTIGK